MQPFPAKSDEGEGFVASHPMLLVVAGDETNGSGMVQGGRLSALIREASSESQQGNCISQPTVVRFYSLKLHNYVHVLRFRSTVYIVRCSPRIVAVALAAQIYCFDAATLENKFSVLTYPLQGAPGLNFGYGPMAVGPRWLAYASNNPLISSTGRLSPQNLTPSPGVSPSTSPSSGSLVARYAMESSKQLAAGILNLGDMGYKTISKYYQELLPDGSNAPLSSSSSRRIGRLPSTVHPSEGDNAGMVVIKDFISKEVISQFRAHTSPISALCFDPSGTLLVTASVHGHNINVFRIMPSSIANNSNSTHYDWTSSHVHLYKLYRGITSAVIQDICFSHYSQWVAIVSARGTCHIFALSPFGGDASLQPQISHNDGPSLTPNLSRPWWSSSSFLMDQQFHPSPPPITISVVSRIKNGSGWLNTVSNVAASATGKMSVPSGALSAVFHNSIYRDSAPVPLKVNSLEHLLIYSPSGHLIQHELLPSSGSDSSDSISKVGSGPLSQHQEEELHVNAEPVQWWDVCRRSNWPEREESVSSIIVNNQQTILNSVDTSDCEDNETKSSINSVTGKESIRSQERPHWFLSNAEVQISSGRIPIWQKSKICFYVMNASSEAGNSVIDNCGEIEIEKLPLHEIEIRRRDLLPVFEQFHCAQQDCNDRGLSGGRFHTLSSESDNQYRFSKDGCVNHSKPVPLASESCSGPGLTDNMQDLDGKVMTGPYEPVKLQSIENSVPDDTRRPNSIVHLENHNGCIVSLPELSHHTDAYATMPKKQSNTDFASLESQHSNNYSLMDGPVSNGLHSKVGSLSSGSAMADKHSSDKKGVSSEVSDAARITNVIDSEQNEASDSHNSVEFTQYFHEGYCKISELDDCRGLTEAVTDADSSSSPCEREKPEEDGDNDDMLGGVFAFSEEG
ncbi:autophagy-related protein 18h-like isoform X2 [Ananas comosus]|uniref:Autophagy-related protein 18h-like isoform X2 n=1 Tax=Ananas comosus TaxID=4615 RepID=A0A6P5EUW6_ANACO|nr:autophagy-related protein 18h-like isoform X2 [Ananas comosus]